MLNNIKIKKIEIDNKILEDQKTNNSPYGNLIVQTKQDLYGNTKYQHQSGEFNNKASTLPTNVYASIELKDLDTKLLSESTKQGTLLRILFTFDKDIDINKIINKNIKPKNYISPDKKYAENFENIDKNIETKLSIQTNTIDYIKCYVFLYTSFEENSISILADELEIFNNNSINDSIVIKDLRTDTKQLFENVFKVSNDDKKQTFIPTPPKEFQIFGTKPIGDILLTRDKFGNSMFSFDINMKQILKEKSHHSKLLSENDAIAQDCAINSKILSLEVYRYRVKESQFKKGEYTYWDYRNHDHELVIQTSDGNDGKLIENEYKIDRTMSGIANYVVGNIKEIDNNRKDIRRINGTDLKAAKLTDGLYCYKVSIVIQDNTDKVLQKYKDITDEMVKEGMNIYNNVISQKNRKEDFLNAYSRNKEKNDRSILSITENILKAKPILNIDEDKIKNLVSMFYPTQASFETISLFSDSINSLSSHISEYLNKNTLSENTNTALHIFSKNGKQIPKLINIDHFWTKNIYDAEIPKDLGFEIFPIPNQKDSPKGFNEIGISDLVSAFNNNILKYYNNLEGSIEVKTENKIYNIGETIEKSNFKFISPKSFNKFENKLNPNNDKVSMAFNTAKLLEMDYGIDNIKHELNEQISITGINIKKTLEKDINSNVDYFLDKVTVNNGQSTEENIRKIDEKKLINNEDLQNLFADIFEQSDFLICGKAVDKMEIDENQLKQAPPQIKAPLLRDEEIAKTNPFETTQDKFFNQKTIFAVEYLNKNNDWVELKNLSQETTDKVLCRITDYASVGGVNSNISNKINIFNNHFTLDLKK